VGGKSKSPDYQGAAIAQGEANREVVRDQTFANRPDQYTPWGFTRWNPYQTTDPSTGEATTGWEQIQGLTPELQEILNKQIAIQGGRSDVAGMLTGRLGNEYGSAMNWDGLSPMGDVVNPQFTMPEGGVDDPYQTRQRAEDAMYISAMSRLQPQFESERSSADVRLRNQGLKPGDAAYDAQMASLGQKQTDQQNQALWSSVGEGRAESGQMFGQQLAGNQNRFQQALGSNAQNYQQAMQGSVYANQIRQQQMAEEMQKRGFSLNEINALMSGQQVALPQMPGFQGAGQAQAAPIYNAAVDQGNANQAGIQGLLQGVGGLGALGASIYSGGLF